MRTESGSLPERIGKQTHNLYNPMLVSHPNGKKEYLSEDWAFCERARRLGYQIWGDLDIPLGHSGAVTINGSKGEGLTKALIRQTRRMFNRYYH